MMSTVALDRDFYGAACQIHDKMTDNKLASETGTACPQTQPQKALGIGRALSQRAGISA